MRIVLPFIGWRVPVVLLRGPAQASGREVVLLCAGQRSDFITRRFFAQEPVVQRSTHVPVWRLQRLLNEWRSTADLVVVGLDRISARLFLDLPHLAVPQWVASWMKVPEDVRAFSRSHKSVQADVRRVRIKHFECQISREPQDFELFYDRFFRPYTTARHGGMTLISPRWMMRLLFRQGLIQWVVCQGERLAGGLVTLEGKQYCKRVSGVLDARMDLMKEGVLSALYVHAAQEARRLGCTEINMGGSLPSLQDGVFRYKSKWATGLCSHDGFVSANCVTMLAWNRLAGPVADFLSGTGLIHQEQDRYSALWAFPADQPLTAAGLKQHYDKLKTTGLHRFDILLPGGVPAGFVCPAEVRLIPMSAVGHGGPELLEAFSHVAPPQMNTPGQSHPHMT